MKVVTCNTQGIEMAVETIQNGGIVVFPTDTVYGVGCDPFNAQAVNRIYKIKNRDVSKSVPLLGFSQIDLEKIAFFDERTIKISRNFWPGPLTLLLKLKDKKLKKSLNLKEKIALRIPKNDCLLSILEKSRLLVGTSANLSGENPFTDPQECKKNFSGYDLFVDGGIISSQGESTVLEVNEELKILREGVISKEEVLNLF